MKSKITLAFFLAAFLCSSTVKAQTETQLYNFEDGVTQSGTWAMAWPEAAYLKAFDLQTNPSATGINTTSKTMRIQEEGAMQWWNNSVQFTLTSPVTITSANRYLHIFHRSPRITAGGFSVNINPDFGNDGGVWGDPEKGSRRFDSNLTAIDTWQDVVVDLNVLITSSATLAKFAMVVDLNNWNSNAAPLGDYYYDEIILSSSPLPRGTTFLTGNNLYDFEAGTSANITGISTNGDTGNPVTYPVANPFVTATNLTANVGKRSAVSDINWWVGFAFTFANPVQVDVNHQYLHIMMMTPIDGQSVTFDVKQGATNVIADGVKVITTANIWQDVVLDVSGMAYISGMSIKCGNWAGTAVGDYYFDEIYIDGNSDPRVNVSTALITPDNTMKIFAVNKNICIENIIGEKQLNIYNANGQNIFSKQIRNKEIVSMNNAGLYFVKIGNETSKVIVK
ncbi:MAG: T9SS type A sorting domain-containing protein [Paludibacter sp.]|nr:T9SS type A sorting domain-containing protein [Paludibacter sp.]